MKLFSVFRKTLREMLREPLILALSLVFAPFFVLLYYLFFPSGSTTYSVMVLNQDMGAQTQNGAALHAGQDVIAAMRQVRYPNGSPMLIVSVVMDRADAEARLRNRDAAALVILPADFSRTLQAIVAGQTGLTTSVTLVGDLTNPAYAVTAIMSSTPLDAYVQAYTGIRSPILLNEIPLGASAARTEFENYVPGLLVFAVILLIFLAAMTVAREVETGTLRRLQLTHMTSFDLLGGISLALVIVGAAAVLLGFLTAQLLGFRSQGPLWVAILVGMVTALSIIGAGLVVACFARSVSQAFVIANFPLALFMFFSNAIFPLPKVSLFSLGGHVIGLYDFLPPTHAVSALNKVLTLGATLGDITFELGALVVLSALYFGIGVWLFQRRHLRST
jgi:ABC-2 type transport system permease protein